MSNLSENPRKYWKIEEILPTRNNIGQVSLFELQNENWAYCSQFSVFHPEWLTIKVYYTGHGSVNQFSVHLGIAEESGKDIVVSSTELKLPHVFLANKFIRHSKFNSILQENKILNFFVEIKRKGEEIAQERVVPMTKHPMDFKELLLTGENSDVIIKVKRRKFNCHRLVLGARSPVFEAMMKHDMKEKRSGEVTITDAEPTAFQEFLSYIYNGSEENLSWKNIAELYKLGDKYCVQDLKDLCVKRMVTNMSMENFFQIFLLSQQHNDSDLTKAAMEFFVKHSKEIVNSKKWIAFLRRSPGDIDVLKKIYNVIEIITKQDRNK